MPLVQNISVIILPEFIFLLNERHLRIISNKTLFMILNFFIVVVILNPPFNLHLVQNA